MTALSALFTAVARDTSNTHLVHDTAEGYRDLFSRDSYALPIFVPDMKDAFNMGHTLEETIETEIVSNVIRSGSGNQSFPGYNSTQTGKKITAKPSFMANYLKWNENEVAVNLDPAQGMQYVKAQMQKTFDAKKQQCKAAMIENLETGLFATPDQTAMEAGDMANSVPYYITENVLGTSGHPLQADGSVCSTINGVTVAETNGNYDNIRRTYTGVNSTAVNAGTDLLSAITGARRRARWQGAPIHPEISGPESMPEIVLTTHWGIDLLQTCYKAHTGNQWGAMEESTMGLKIAGMTFVALDVLAEAELYSNHATTPTGLATETASVVTGPRFYGISRRHMRMLFQKDLFMKGDEPTRLTEVGQVYNWVKIYKTANQLWNPDRRRHFIVSPLTSQTPA